MKKILAILLVVALMTVMIAACAAPDAPPPVDDAEEVTAPEPAAPAELDEADPVDEPAEQEDAGDETFRVAIQLLPIPNAFHAVMRDLIEEAAEAAPANFEFEIFGSTDENDQIRVLEVIYEEAMRGEWDGVIISPQNGTLVGPIAEQMYNSGIPVVIINRLTDPEVFTAYVAGDNPGGARDFAHYVGAALPDGGTVFEVRMTAGTPIDRDRHYPFVEVLEANYPDVEWLGSGEGGNSFEMGYELGMNALMAHDVINVVYAHDEFAARGFWNAVIDAGREDDLVLVGFWGGTREFWYELDEDPDLVLRGIAYQPAMGTLAVQTMIRILQGETVDFFTVEPSMIFGPHNMDEWYDLSYWAN